VTESQRVDLARIRRSQQHLASLIDNVLNFVRLETGHLPFRIENVPLQSTLQDVEELVLPQMERKGIRFVPWRGAESVFVRADAEKLRQILINLLTNALKFTPAGGEIALSVATDAETVRVSVRDTGIGIPADMLERVFEPFVQLGALSSAPTEGVGLGLAISRDFARKMGGDIGVESVVGSGSTFTLQLVRAGGGHG
jgi:signal transduction histidine kinase